MCMEEQGLVPVHSGTSVILRIALREYSGINVIDLTRKDLVICSVCYKANLLDAFFGNTFVAYT